MKKPILPPLYLLCSIGIMLLLHLFFPGPEIFHRPENVWGIALVMLGMLVILMCALRFRRVDTTIKPFKESTTLIVTGLFRYSRNPIYVGMVMMLVGVWIGLRTLTGFFVIPIFIWLIQKKFIVREEEMLREKFGESYAEYQRRVRRWL